MQPFFVCGLLYWFFKLYVFLFIKVFTERNYLLLMVINIIWFARIDKISSAFLTDRAQDSIKNVHTSIQHDIKISTNIFQLCQKGSKRKPEYFLRLWVAVWYIQFYLFSTITLTFENQSNKKLYEFMGEWPCFDSTILLRVSRSSRNINPSGRDSAYYPTLSNQPAWLFEQRKSKKLVWLFPREEQITTTF